MSRLSELLSCVVLLSVSFDSILQYSKQSQPPVPFLGGTFIITALYATLGVIKLSSEHNDNLRKWREVVLFLIPTIGLPCAISELWFRNRVVNQKYIGVHLGIGAILIVLRYGIKNISTDTFDIIVGINSLALIGVAIAYENYLSALSGLIFISAHYGAHQYDLELNVPHEDLYNYCLAGFIYCACLSVIPVK